MDRFCQPHSPYPILAARPAGGRFRPKSRPNPAFAGHNPEKAQYSDTPVLQHSARQDSRTTTKRLVSAPASFLRRPITCSERNFSVSERLAPEAVPRLAACLPKPFSLLTEPASAID